MGCEYCKVDNPKLYKKCGGGESGVCLLEVRDGGGKMRRKPTNYTQPKKKRRKRLWK